MICINLCGSCSQPWTFQDLEMKSIYVRSGIGSILFWAVLFPPYLSPSKVLIAFVCICACMSFPSSMWIATDFFFFLSNESSIRPLLCCVSNQRAGITQRVLESTFWCQKSSYWSSLKNGKKMDKSSRRKYTNHLKENSNC